MNVMITGGSRGIGAAAVRAFSARGDRVAFLYEKEYEKAAAVAAETGAIAIRCDVSDEAAVNAAFARLPGADVLINNAGIADYDLINVITPARWRRLFAVNVDGAFYCIRAALPHMLRQQTPIERLGTPEDIARAMVYLADAEFITGQVLPVNGGFVIT